MTPLARLTPLALSLALGLVLGASASAQDPHQPTTPERALRWQLPAGWEAQPAGSAMRALQVKVPGGLELVVYHFGVGKGGSPAENFERWLGQIKPEGEQSAAEAATRGLRLQHRLVIQTLDVSGTYVAETRPGSGDFVRAPKSRLLAAVVEGGDGPYFVKLVGPEAAVAAQAKAYEAFLRSLSAGPRLGLGLRAPATWSAAPPSNRMRCAELSLPGEVSLVVYHFGEGGGGGVEANFARWLGQLKGADGGPVEGKRASFKVEGFEVFTLDASGTFASGMPGQAKVNKAGQRLLGAVVVGAGGPYFFKLVGPEDKVEEHFAAYDALLHKGLEVLE